MAYLSYYKLIEQYDDLQYIEDLLATFHPGSLPNAEAVDMMLKLYANQWLNVPFEPISAEKFLSPIGSPLRMSLGGVSTPTASYSKTVSKIGSSGKVKASGFNAEDN